jgi:CBS-domain-containing membrane protein
MSFAIIDQGRRVSTPLRSIFPDKGVDKTSASEASHTATHDDKDLQTKHKDFRDLLERHRSADDKTPATYDGLKPSSHANSSKKGLIASQIMSQPVHTIIEGTTAHAAWERMQNLHISHLLVTNAAGKTMGILAKNDVLKIGKESTQSITPYYNKQMIAGLPTTQVDQIAACFLEFDINGVPIFDSEEELVGIVCRADLLRLIISGAHIERWA